MQPLPIGSLIAWLAALLFLTPATSLAAGSCYSAPHSNIGCEFYAVTLPNILVDQSTFPFGVNLLNPSSSTAVDVTVTGGGLMSPQMLHLAAGGNLTTTLPWVASLSTSTATQIVSGGGYHIVSTGPISALQLNPATVLSGFSQSSSNDASLLLPVRSAGTSFRTVAWPTWVAASSPGQLAVVATVASTNVTVTASGSIEPGAGLTANGGMVTLDAGDVLLVSSALASSASLSGALIASSAPVIVWSAHAGTQVPIGVAYADHLEDPLPPISALGTDYFIVRPSNPSGASTGAVQYVTIVASSDNTTMTYDPPVAAPLTLAVGASATFQATVDFHLVSSAPVLVGQFMEGGTTPGFGGNGDPSELIAIPTNQAQRTVTFYAPALFSPIFAQVIAPTGTALTIDGTAVTGWTAIGNSGYSASNYALCCVDVHQATGNQPFTLSVYAYPPGSTSYWYAGASGIGDDIFADGFQ